MIEVKNLHREFRITKKHKGLTDYIENLLKTENQIKVAVDNISFTIEDGEAVGFIGPNGAGKSTTIKMMSGILYPTSGEIIINGLIPYKNRKTFVKNIGVVFGQKSQLWPDLTIVDTFNLLKYIYKIPDSIYKRNLEMFNDMLELHKFENQMVRKLSLGQRMRADLVAAFLHNPEILFLDEPTIGLDMVAKQMIRDFLNMVNQEYGTTLLFTTHDMQDVESICKRIIIIDDGKIIYDDSLSNIRRIYGKERTLVVEFGEIYKAVHLKGVKIIEDKENSFKKSFVFSDTIKVQELISRLSEQNCINDLSIKEPEIEKIIQEIYKCGRLS